MKLLVAHTEGDEINEAVLALAKKSAQLLNATLHIASSI